MNPFVPDSMVQMNGAQFTVKLEDTLLEGHPESEEPPPYQGAHAYMGSFGKHNPAFSMFYHQFPHDWSAFLPLPRLRSASTDPLDAYDDTVTYSQQVVNYPVKETRYNKPKGKGSAVKKNHEDEMYGIHREVNDLTIDETMPDLEGKPQKSFFCRACCKSFKFQTSLLRHNNKVHMSKYQCSTCARLFSRQAYLDVHISKQNSSCYLDPTLRNPRSRPLYPTMCATQD